MGLTELRGLAAPAKLNLFLHVTGRRADGYHLLQSVFVLLDWCDHIDVRLREDGQIERHDTQAGLALPTDDLCVQAARALQQATGCRLGASIVLHKHLPAEAGLGGGSSDAATCLLALNHLWGLHLSRTALADIGLSLGADVPFFVHGHSAWVEGIGERISPLPVQETGVVVLKPPVGASTRDIFTAPDLCRHTAAVDPRAWPVASEVSPAALMQGTHNDLQPVATRLCPSIGEAIVWLERQGLTARMSGSGSAVFALAPDRCEIETAPVGWTLKKCRILRKHPVFDLCSG
jgi:4-diphosphocytidyl-2-C-methyl-D-erythritol kinase